MGGGEREGLNMAPVSEQSELKSLTMLKQISSAGYLRKRLPQDLMVLQAGVSATAILSAEPAAMDLRMKAKMQGYEGDPCGECGNYTLVRNGTCMKCNTCGGTSGCS